MLQRMMNILIPTDFSQNAWNALEYASKLFKDTPCTFHILHIGDLKDSDIKGNFLVRPFPQTDAQIKQEMGHLFERIKKMPHNRNHHFIALQEYGNILSIVRKKVEDLSIQLIVMGTKGASGVKKTIVGSNTGDVITKIQCNVLVVPEKAQFVMPRNIAFPTDYNIFYSHTILENISDMLQISRATLYVMHAELSDGLSKIQLKNKAYLQDYLEEAFSELHAFHSVKNRKIGHAIPTFISDHSIDLVIMVAKNLNFLQQLLFDSTIEKLSFHTTVPLLVLHE